jgi:Cu+-exporting ATPase
MTTTLIKDPVCGMNVETTATAARSEYKGQTYSFCCSGCKAKFDHAPEQYLSQFGNNQQSDKSGCCCS